MKTNPTPQPTIVQNKPQLSAEMEKRLNDELKKRNFGRIEDINVGEIRHFLATALEEQRQEILSEVGGWLVDEDIDIVHHFYSCRVSSEHRCPQCKKTGCEAYVYSGGMVNGRNSLRAELRARLNQLKDSTLR